MGKRDAPSRHDRKGVKARRKRANDEHDRLGLYLLVPNRRRRGGEASASVTFSAHTRRTLREADRAREARVRGGRLL